MVWCQIRLVNDICRRIRKIKECLINKGNNVQRISQYVSMLNVIASVRVLRKETDPKMVL